MALKNWQKGLLIFVVIVLLTLIIVFLNSSPPEVKIEDNKIVITEQEELYDDDGNLCSRATFEDLDAKYTKDDEVVIATPPCGSYLEDCNPDTCRVYISAYGPTKENVGIMETYLKCQECGTQKFDIYDNPPNERCYSLKDGVATLDPGRDIEYDMNGRDFRCVGLSQSSGIVGCTDEDAINYNSSASIAGDCEY